MMNTTAVNNTQKIFMEDHNQSSGRKFIQQTAMVGAGLMPGNPLQVFSQTNQSTYSCHLIWWGWWFVWEILKRKYNTNLCVLMVIALLLFFGHLF